MATMTCKSCKRKGVVYNDNEDVVTCASCGSEMETGNEKKLRKNIEKAYVEGGPIHYPRATVARAAGYSAEVYGLASHGIAIDFAGIERAVSAKVQGAKLGIIADSIHGQQRKLMDSATNSMMTDRGVGVLIVPLVVPPGNVAQIYVVFRGSRGDTGDATDSRSWKSLWMKPNTDLKNPREAGWDRGRNLDWRANMTFQLATPPWDASTKVHVGFLALYESVRTMIHHRVAELVQQYPGSSVIVTGHSLGAGLAILCTHDLQKSGVCKPFCFPFCPPRAGNLAFARDYWATITSRYGPIIGEAGSYPRCILFTQKNDPVSWEMGVGSYVLRNRRGHGFEQSVAAPNQNAVADSGNFLKQAGYGLLVRTQSRVAIFYHVPYVYRAMTGGLHSFDAMEKEMLGWSGRRR